jgi:hypothetical protein
MMEGTVPVPPYCPCALSDDDVIPVQVVSHLGGTEATGVKPLLSVQFFLKQFL